MKFEKTYTVGAREIGNSNYLTNYGILAFLEDVASCHSDSVGYGVKDIQTKKKAWMLMDWNLKVFKRLNFGDTLYAKTWALNMEKTSYSVYRSFEAFDSNKDLIATALTKWVFFDLETNKIAKIDKELIDIYKPENYAEKLTINKIKEPTSFDSVFEYKVKRADIDINKHMHNLEYIALAYEALPENVYNLPEFNNANIMYKHQIKLGDNVKCFYKNEDDKHFVTIKSEDQQKVHAIIELY